MNPRNVDLELGARPLPAGDGVRFRVWAPRAREVTVALGSGTPSKLKRGDDDVFEGVIATARTGSDYVYVIDGDKRRPDPVSRFQPEGVHGPSRVVDPSEFTWSDDAWSVRPLERQVVYELHVGTFTPEGTFDAIVPKLPHLAAVGVTAIELMPVAEFPGGRNWGYDGVHLFAPQSTYGGPDGLRRLVDGAHQHGIGVIIDAVYNHLGPEGNYLAEFGSYFTDRYRTPWGEALNFDGPGSDGVRRHLISNAVAWLTEFHVDGLRLDAVHGIYDFSARHVLEELSSAFTAEANRLGRRAFIIAESDLNDARVIAPRERGGHAIDAQWSDDFHHAVRTALTRDRSGYFEDFGAIADVEKALVDGFVYDGRYSAHRRRRHGGPIGDRPGSQLVVYVQTHDQIANASGGERLTTILDEARQRLATTLLFVAPNVPMLFMGEEYGETAPFHYFVSHTDAALVAAVVEGRKKEHEAFHRDRTFADPSSEETFRGSKLQWAIAEGRPGRQRLALHRALIELRARVPALGNGRRDLTTAASHEDEHCLLVERGDPSSASVLVVANFSGDHRKVPLTANAKTGTYRLVLSSDEPRFGGASAASRDDVLDGARGFAEVGPHTAAIYVRQETA